MTPQLWDYVISQMSPVPGQSPHKLNNHALESFTRMFDAAKNDGINLVIGDSDRPHATSVANAAKSGNPNAVASFSTHNLGLAIDFSIPGFATSTIPMSKLVQERLSPVYKWLFLHAKEYGWFPYQNEPWHWEYNPEGFKEVFMSEHQ